MVTKTILNYNIFYLLDDVLYKAKFFFKFKDLFRKIDL